MQNLTPISAVLPLLAAATFVAKGDPLAVTQILENAKPNLHSDLAISVSKAAIAAGGLGNPAYAGSLEAQKITSAFLETLRSVSIFGRFYNSGFVRIPLGTRAIVITFNPDAYVVGEGQKKPVSSLSLADGELGLKKAVGLLVVSDDLSSHLSSIGANIIGSGLRNSIGAALDANFITGILSSSPFTVNSTGTGSAELLADVGFLFAHVNTSGNRALNFVANPMAANILTTMRTDDGAQAFPGITPNGGELLGLPFLVSDQVPGDNSTGTMILIDAASVAADVNAITIASASHASLQMSDDPAEGATNLVSLWQTNSRALKAEAFFGFEVLRDNAVAVLTGLEPQIVS